MDALNMNMLLSWKSDNLVTNRYTSCLNLTLEATEFMIGTAYSLNRHVEAFFFLSIININLLKIRKKCLTLIPRNIFRLSCYIVTLSCRNRDNNYICK